MFVTNKQRNAMLRATAMILLVVGIIFSTGLVSEVQAASAKTAKAKNATINFNLKAKPRKSRSRKKVAYRKAKYHKVRRALARSKKNTLRRSPAKRRVIKTSRRRYRGLAPRLRLLLATVGRHYGRRVVISSGCRSRANNRRIGGAKRSMHLRCMAADIKVAGVSKSRLRRYLQRLPGRGGVGTYCGRSIVHLDVGPVRSWYHGCRKRRRSRRG